MSEWRRLSDTDPQLEGYEISDDGRIRSYHGRGRGYANVLLDQPTELRTCTVTRTGRKAIRLRLAGGRGHQVFEVHDLVARAFLGPRPPGSVIDFRDQERLNLHRSNLEYVPRREAARRRAAYEVCVAKGITEGMPWLKKPRQLKTPVERAADLRQLDDDGPLLSKESRQRLLSRYVDGGPEDEDLIEAGLSSSERPGGVLRQRVTRMVAELETPDSDSEPELTGRVPRHGVADLEPELCRSADADKDEKSRR